LVRAGALAAIATVIPRVALACPSCAANPDGGITRYVLIGLMILAPYVAATVVIRLVRRGEASLRASESLRPNAVD
jgi:hypothetical protein